MTRNKKAEIETLDIIVSELMWLRVQRKKFELLFENEKNRKEINFTASQFFYELNIMLIYDINLMITRLTDPYDEKNSNLSLSYFLKSKFIKNKVELCILYKEIIDFRNKIIKDRNKIISHNDLKTYMEKKTYGQFEIGEDIKCIENIQKYLNIVSKELKGKIFGDISVGCSGDVNELLKIIKYGNCIKRKWHANNEIEKEKVRNIVIECLSNDISDQT